MNSGQRLEQNNEAQKVLQPIAQPLRGFASAELSRYARGMANEIWIGINGLVPEGTLRRP